MCFASAVGRRAGTGQIAPVTIDESSGIVTAPGVPGVLRRAATSDLQPAPGKRDIGQPQGPRRPCTDRRRLHYPRAPMLLLCDITGRTLRRTMVGQPDSGGKNFGALIVPRADGPQKPSESDLRSGWAASTIRYGSTERRLGRCLRRIRSGVREGHAPFRAV